MSGKGGSLPRLAARPLALLLPDDETYRAKTSWGAVPAIAATALIGAIASGAAFLAARAFDLLTGLGEPRAFPAGALERLVMSHEAVFLATLHLTVIALVFSAAGLFKARAADVLALDPPSAGARAYRFGLLAALAATAAWFCVFIPLEPVLVKQDIVPYRIMMAREWSWLMPPLLCVLAPLSEELLFRGFLFSALAKSRLGPLGATIVTAAAWTAAHTGRTDLAYLQLFCAGVFFGWLLLKTGSIRVGLLCHILFNAGMSFIVIGMKWPPIPLSS